MSTLADVRPFPIQRKNRPRQTTSLIDPERFEKVAELLGNWIDDVLFEVAQCSLNSKGLGLVDSIAGEALDNAQTHSDLISEDGDWTVAGFMTRVGKRYRFHLSFLSVGATIAESLRNCPEIIRASLNAYLKRHSKARPDLSTEDLTTVFALQDGVTRLERKLEGEGQKGGTGLADVIEFFSELAGEGNHAKTARLAIVSGSSYIRVAPPFSRALRESVAGLAPTERAPRRIWFNKRNSDAEPPDPAHVFSLPGRLQGTLVTMAFDLDRKYLQESAG
jgi:hypothetical protein